MECGPLNHRISAETAPPNYHSGINQGRNIKGQIKVRIKPPRSWTAPMSDPTPNPEGPQQAFRVKVILLCAGIVVAAIAAMAVAGANLHHSSATASAVTSTVPTPSTTMASRATVTSKPPETTTATHSNTAAATTVSTSTKPVDALSPEQQNDLVYIANLDIHHVQYTSQAGAITVAHSICAAKAAGHTDDEIGLTIIDTGQYSASDAGTIVGSAESAYCP